MRREFGDLQNLPQDLRTLTFFAWDLDITQPFFQGKAKIFIQFTEFIFGNFGYGL
jgi:hypothetical protein